MVQFIVLYLSYDLVFMVLQTIKDLLTKLLNVIFRVHDRNNLMTFMLLSYQMTVQTDHQFAIFAVQIILLRMDLTIPKMVSYHFQFGYQIIIIQ